MFHLVLDENAEIMITPSLDKVQEFFAVQEVLLPGAPLTVLASISQAVTLKALSLNRGPANLINNPVFKRLGLDRFALFQSPLGSKPRSAPQLKRQVLEKANALYPGLDWQWAQTAQVASQPNDKDLAQDLLQGPLASIDAEFAKRTRCRVLTPADFKRLAQELGEALPTMLFIAQLRAEQGLGSFIPAIAGGPERWQCQRCGAVEMQEWPSIYGPAVTCTECISLGALSSLDFLYDSRDEGRTPGRSRNSPNHRSIYVPSRQPTVAQAKASREILTFMEDDQRQQLLLWAACGAGKTEVVFPTLEWALLRGLSVLFAAPRRDVIHDIAPRIARDFPGVSFQLLTGSAPKRFEEGKLVLATTHQVLRFRQGFDLIILDELDAFPYSGSRMLAWGIAQALKADGKLIYLTATPAKTLRQQAVSGQVQLVRIPARHHGQPLPVPVWLKDQAIGQTQVSNALHNVVVELVAQGPVLVFVPTIKQVEPWVGIIQSAFPGLTVAGSHSRDLQRQQKIGQFLNGECQVLVSTTILERGVTFPGVQVIVLHADHPIFDERALVQMAGRAGRTTEYPSGRVVFVAPTETPAMAEAIQWIAEQNRLAKEQGLIFPES